MDIHGTLCFFIIAIQVGTSTSFSFVTHQLLLSLTSHQHTFIESFIPHYKIIHINTTLIDLFVPHYKIIHTNTTLIDSIMPPTIHLVRHAQGHHNLRKENETLPDPDLTALGVQQCAALRAQFPHHHKLQALVASGMRRTLHTCIRAFGPDTGADTSSDSDTEHHLYPVIALDTLQECSDAPSDTGSSREKLAAEFGANVDVSRIRDGWDSKGEGSYFEPSLEKLPARARDARLALREIAAGLGDGDDDDAHVAVVSHGAFLHFLTEDWHGITAIYRKICQSLCLFVEDERRERIAN